MADGAGNEWMEEKSSRKKQLGVTRRMERNPVFSTEMRRTSGDGLGHSMGEVGEMVADAGVGWLLRSFLWFGQRSFLAAIGVTWVYLRSEEFRLRGNCLALRRLLCFPRTSVIGRRRDWEGDTPAMLLLLYVQLFCEDIVFLHLHVLCFLCCVSLRKQGVAR